MDRRQCLTALAALLFAPLTRVIPKSQKLRTFLVYRSGKWNAMRMADFIVGDYIYALYDCEVADRIIYKVTQPPVIGSNGVWEVTVEVLPYTTARDFMASLACHSKANYS